MFRLTEAQLRQLQNLPVPSMAMPAEPWELQGREAFWVVAEGRVEVFLQSLRTGEPEGYRQHLLGFQAGDVIREPALPPGFPHLKAVAVGSAGGRLLAGELGRRPGSAEADLGGLLKASFAWAFLCGLARHVIAEGQPALAALLRPGQDAGLKAGERAAAPLDLAWMQVRRGRVLLLGDPASALEPEAGPFPLVRGLWLQAGDAGASVACLPAGEEDWPEHAGWDLALERFVPCLMAREARRYEAEDQERLDRMRLQAEAEGELRRRSLSTLAALTAPRPPQEPPPPQAGAILDACRMAGRHQGITFQAPPRWVQEDRSRDPLAAICRASRVRLRRVALRGPWWRQDVGALLGFLGEERTPVALIPRERGGGYLLQARLQDPPEPLEPDTASRLEPFAYAFYRPAPSGPMKARDLFSLTWSAVRADAGWALGMALCGGLVGLALPVALGLMMSQAIPQADLGAVGVLFLALVCLNLGGGLFGLSRGLALLRVEGRTAAVLQAAMVDRLLALPAGFFRRFAVGDLMLRATAVEQAHAVISGAAATGLLSALFSALSLALLFYYDSRLAWVAMALAAGTTAFYAAVITLRRRLETARREAIRARSALVFQLLGGIAKLRVAAAEGRAFAVWCERLWADQRLALRDNRYQEAMEAFGAFLPVGALLAIYAAVDFWRQGADTGLQPAAFLAFSSAFGTFFAAAVSIGSTLTGLQQAKPILDQARPILELQTEEDQAKPDPGCLRGDLEAARLCFRYRADGPLALQDVSFHAAPGEFVALVGASGSGKSTALRLLLGFEQPEAGAVYYDRQDLRTVDIASLRSQIGVVLQSSRLVGGSVWQNIVGAANLGLDDAWAAAEAAGLADDIRDLPMGMQTVVSEGGGTLSGGQRQRILIARALVRKPRIILFDEATSALDNRTQALVSRSLELTSATRIVIAHRLSTIQNADRIYVLDQGRVAQEGSYGELSGREGLFRELARRQVA